MVIGMIFKSMPLAPMQIQMFVLKMKEQVSSETILLTHAADTVFVSSIIWFQGNIHVNQLFMTIQTQPIHTGKTLSSQLISMILQVGRMAGMEQLQKKSVILGGITSRLLITNLLEWNSVSLTTAWETMLPELMVDSLSEELITQSLLLRFQSLMV